MTGEEKLHEQLIELACENSMLGIFGLPVWGIVFREYIEMDTIFKAFRGRMPVNPERRFFAESGHVNCEHVYWVEDAIWFRKGEEPDNWREELAKINGLWDEDELRLVIRQVGKISSELTKHLGGEWSIDFCKGADGTWYLIDVAPAELSWHPPHEGEIKEKDEEIIEWQKILKGKNE